MKFKIIFIVLTLLPLRAFCDYSLHSVFFTTSNTGFAVGADWSSNTVLILKTTNGGNGWTMSLSGDSSFLYSVYFIDENTGYAVGEDLTDGYGIIYKTTDGGNNWNSQKIGLGNTFRAVHFPTPETGYIVGVDFYNGSVIKKTTDGGITWFDQLSGTENWLWSVYFIDAYTGFAAGVNGTILKTTNGGEIWETLQSGTNYFLSAIWFINVNTGFAVGENGIILKTTDGGVNWQNVPSGTISFLHSIYFTDSSNGFLVGNVGVILKTTNTGDDWNIQPSGTYEDLLSVHFPNYTDGYVIGTQENFLKTSDEGINWNSIVMKTMQVFSPNGGEHWYNGSNHYIRWNAHSIENVKIEFSINNGITWSTIVDSHINNERFFWTIIVPAGSEECLVKISDVADSNVYDISNEIFTIVPVNITITSPNGGEVWLNGSIHEITWTNQNLNASNLRIRLSIDDGLNWNTIALAIPNTGSFSWLLNTNIASDDCLLKIETLDHFFYDLSDSTFTIEILPGVEDMSKESTVNEFYLFQNSPNPFNPSTKISWHSPVNSLQTLKVYDVLGNEISTLVDEVKPAGSYEVEFSADGLTSGIYFYKLQAGSFVETKKMILMK